MGAHMLRQGARPGESLPALLTFVPKNKQVGHEQATALFRSHPGCRECYVRLLAGMGAHMPRQVAQLGESLPALLTFVPKNKQVGHEQATALLRSHPGCRECYVRLLAGMYEHMCRQVALPGESLPALLALVPETNNGV
jgi:hypothetical protein